MRNGKCPKCGSATVYAKEGGVGQSAIHVYTGFLSVPVKFRSYVCTTCGYYENYIVDEKKLAEVAAKWERVDGRGGS